MKRETIKKYIKLFNSVKRSNKSLRQFCIDKKIGYNNIIIMMNNIRKKEVLSENEVKLLHLYETILQEKKSNNNIINHDNNKVEYIRDENGIIQCYSYEIFIRDKNPLVGKLTREEMNMIHRLYSYYGDALTQRTISRYFVDLSLIDFKRILRAFNITKASSPFAPHMFEECGEEELRNIQLREKENSFLRKAEEDIVKNNEKLLKKYAQENIELKKQLEKIQFDINIENIVPTKCAKLENSNKSINLYLSDMHIGASVVTGTLFKENVNYGVDEVKRRLTEVLNKLKELGHFDNINLVLMGDNVDCCGIFGKTARMDHDMPENMDVREQANNFINIVLWFVSSIVNNNITSNMNVYSVPCGNHAGNFEYICNKALLSTITSIFPDIKTTLWEEYYGVFKTYDHTFVCCHGKDFGFMRKGMPLNLDDKTKIMLYEWLHENGINENNIHIIKGDLHSNSLSSCKRLSYRNVLSLFGASDYSAFNFSRTSYGLSYDLFINNNMIRGTFENI